MLQEGRKGSKYTVNLAPAAAERTTPRKSSTPKRMRSSAAALEFGDRENADPFRGSRDLIPR